MMDHEQGETEFYESLVEAKEQSKQPSLAAKQAYINGLEQQISDLQRQLQEKDAEIDKLRIPYICSGCESKDRLLTTLRAENEKLREGLIRLSSSSGEWAEYCPACRDYSDDVYHGDQHESDCWLAALLKEQA